MTRFVNILTGWLAFGCVLILAQTGAALRDRVPSDPITLRHYIFLGLVVASIFFLQYAAERYFVPAGIFSKEQRNNIFEGSWIYYRRGAIGISYFFLILYAFEYLTPDRGEKTVNWIMPALFCLLFGIAGTTRGIILHLARQPSGAALSSTDSSK